jgi:hypothetical protein
MNLLRTNFSGFENEQDIIDTYSIISDISVVKRDLPHYTSGGNPGIYLHQGDWRNAHDWDTNDVVNNVDQGPPYLTYGPGAYGGSNEKNIPLNMWTWRTHQPSNNAPDFPFMFPGDLNTTLEVPISNGVALSYSSGAFWNGCGGFHAGRVCTGSNQQPNLTGYPLGWIYPDPSPHDLIEIKSSTYNTSILFRFQTIPPTQGDTFSPDGGYHTSRDDYMSLGVYLLSGGSYHTIRYETDIPILNLMTKIEVSGSYGGNYGASGHIGFVPYSAKNYRGHWLFPIAFKYDPAGATYDFFVYHERITGSLTSNSNSSVNSAVNDILNSPDSTVIIRPIMPFRSRSNSGGWVDSIGGWHAWGIANLSVNDLQGTEDNDSPGFNLIYDTTTINDTYVADFEILNPENLFDDDRHGGETTKTVFPDSNTIYININNKSTIETHHHHEEDTDGVWADGVATLPSDSTAPTQLAVTIHGVTKQPFDTGKFLRACITDQHNTPLTEYHNITPTVHTTTHSLYFKEKIGGSPITIGDLDSFLKLKVETLDV